MGTARDVAVIVLAVASLISLGLLIALVIAIIRFFKQIRIDLKPLIDSGKLTLDTLKEFFQLFGESLSALAPLSKVGQRSSRWIRVFRTVTKLVRRRKS
ncbi:MAG: hypothetical protein NTU59_07395 [Coprothermobacterota bacterium]|nr:hypothetical protein [Coprothermobacterota bacterium]